VGVKLPLPEEMEDCPQWWRSFARQTMREAPEGIYGWVHLERVMKEYNGTFASDSSGVWFDTEEDLMVFKLKWMG